MANRVKFSELIPTVYTKRIGKAYTINSELTYFEKHYRENMDYDSYETVEGDGCIFNGQAGSGKTERLCQMVMEAEKPLFCKFYE